MNLKSILSPTRSGLLMAFVLLASPVAAQNPIHVTYLWHMHQPIYYPRMGVADIDAAGLFSFSVRGVHDMRTGPYTDWPRNAVQGGADRGLPHAGVQLSFSGSLMENLDGIWSSTWPNDYRHGRNTLQTSLNNPRLDLVGFAYHHSLMPLTSRESMKMQIRLHREAYIDTWNTGGSYSKGFFPPESSFALHMIPALVSEGIEWVLVDSGHIDRTLLDFPWSDASSIRPNRADQRNGVLSQWNSEWTQLQNIWAPTPVAAPFSYQPHYMRYVDPWSDPEDPDIYRMIAVPAGRYEGNENARGGYGAFKPDNVWGPQVGRNNNPARPMIIVAHSDGDNHGMLNREVYFGSHSAFLDMVQSNANFTHTTVQDYLELYPPPTNSVIHVEPGSWIGIDGGTPFYEKWVEDNARDGEHPDHWNWSVLIAAMNRVLHAEALEDDYTIQDVLHGVGSDTARAWYHYLNAEASDYWYWDFDRLNPWDGNVTRAANLAITEANKVIARHPGVDTVGPSIFHPQRPIWNPGGKHWNETQNQPSDFEIWTFVDDVSGVAEVSLYWRTADLVSYDDLNDYAQEIYAHTPGKNSPWNIVPMTGSIYPPVQGPLVPDPLHRAARYAGEITGQSDVLIGYFVEAVDTVGNTNRSEIFHVWVGEGTGIPEPDPRVTFSEDPRDCAPLTVNYDAADGPLAGINPVVLRISLDFGVTWEAHTMTAQGPDLWAATVDLSGKPSVAWVRFENSDGSVVDDNLGNDWSVGIRDCDAPVGPVSLNPPSPDGCGPITIIYDPAGRNLAGASQVRIHIGRNGWQNILSPDPAMTAAGSLWTYVYTPPPGTHQINFVFNDGSGTWDNNNGQDWHFDVSNCPDLPPPPTGLAITNPPADEVVGHAVTEIELRGIAENIDGDLTWSNTLTGAWGSFPAATPWVLPGVSLAVGENDISVSGVLAGSGDVVTNAYDQAANYGGGWSNGSNQGLGFEPWSLQTTGTGGRFISSANGWGLWSQGDGVSQAVRPFGSPMSVGQRFHAVLRNRTIHANQRMGLALRHAAGQPLVQFYFDGAHTHYRVEDAEGARATSIAWTDEPQAVTIELLDASSYRMTVDATEIAGTYSGVPAEVRFWDSQGGQGSDYDVFFNHIALTTPGTGEGVVTSATVRITREAGDADSNGDGVPDQWYLDNGFDPTIPDLAQQMGLNGHTLGDSFQLNLNPNDPDSTMRVEAVRMTADGLLEVDWAATDGRRYVIQHTPDLSAVPFADVTGSETDVVGAGSNRVDRTTDMGAPGGGAMGHYRVRFMEPLD